MNKINVLFGKRIKQLRLEKGLTQLDIATVLNTDATHVSRIELARVDVRISTAVKIAEALEVPIAELFDLDKLN